MAEDRLGELNNKEVMKGPENHGKRETIKQGHQWQEDSCVAGGCQ